jgi:hypothetical protein
MNSGNASNTSSTRHNAANAQRGGLHLNCSKRKTSVPALQTPSRSANGANQTTSLRSQPPSSLK